MQPLQQQQQQRPNKGGLVPGWIPRLASSGSIPTSPLWVFCHVLLVCMAADAGEDPLAVVPTRAPFAAAAPSNRGFKADCGQFMCSRGYYLIQLMDSTVPPH